MRDRVDEFRSRILERKPLRLRGGGSKDFYGGPLSGEILDTRGYSGIVGYEPTELVITARAGTPLVEIESALATRRQVIACEPPQFGAGATIGGTVAAGLSGPRRATAGSLRDFVLGVKLMDGEGRELNFGGQVMKNVAGFDVSRLVTGSLGTLGLILEVSLKVLPQPLAETTLRFEMPQNQALAAMNRWAGQPLPLAASCWQDGVLTLRLCGAKAAVLAACEKLGGERVAESDAASFWAALREQAGEFFAGDAPLWRLSLPSVAPPLELPGPLLIEWGGAQRWLRGTVDVATLRETAARAGGHASLFRGGDKSGGVFAPLPPALMEVHRRLKQSFDPYGVFNPGRLYPEL
ncbi:MAG: glycolate oxidase subunit GlcE [Rhodocyclales bacterium RIFCSPLOWO2_02_FULL_63_24]|nr:MAG: glycolate oxidase subunit GlcE [Rhodocyclales bacterium GWA2_65_19]OHC68562.1 MAG: glycolate oxidase subunit GlcE [Rhodocyclales bacterium RIFCSPLOWO2_02_FULL_63_24]